MIPPKINTGTKLIILILAFFFAPTSFGKLEKIPSNKPLYEVGLIGGGGFVPDYPASDQGRLRYLGVPQFRYRGLRFRSDEEDSLKARIFKHSVYGIDFSGSGAFSAKSSKNKARRGMRDLDWVGELGPRLYIFLAKTDKIWVRLFFPVRVAFSTDFTSTTYQGLVFAPAFNVRYYFDKSKFNSFIFSVSRTHTTHQLQEFYYEVRQKDVTMDRPLYNARAGYMSSTASIAYIYEKEKLGIYFGASGSSYKGSANAGSPLHRADYNIAAFAGFSYLFFQSEARGFQ